MTSCGSENGGSTFLETLVHVYPTAWLHIPEDGKNARLIAARIPHPINYLIDGIHRDDLSPSWESGSMSVVKKFPTFYGTRTFISLFTRDPESFGSS
jgi:hypothetical protein